MTVIVSLYSTQQSRRNNHLRMHRQALRDGVKGLHPPVRLLTLNWSLDLPHAEIHRICADRVLARSANHRMLHGNKHGKAHESVIWQFLHTTEPLADDEVNTIVEMDIREDLSKRFHVQSTQSCACWTYPVQTPRKSAPRSATSDMSFLMCSSWCYGRGTARG